MFDFTEYLDAGVYLQVNLIWAVFLDRKKCSCAAPSCLSTLLHVPGKNNLSSVLGLKGKYRLHSSTLKLSLSYILMLR